jgi:hypothetical protein
MTDGEHRFMLHILSKCGNGYSSYESAAYLLKDNYSWFRARDLVNDQYSQHQVSGYISSLYELGVLAQEEPDDWCLEQAMFETWLFPEFWNQQTQAEYDRQYERERRAGLQLLDIDLEFDALPDDVPVTYFKTEPNVNHWTVSDIAPTWEEVVIKWIANEVKDIEVYSVDDQGNEIPFNAKEEAR